MGTHWGFFHPYKWRYVTLLMTGFSGPPSFLTGFAEPRLQISLFRALRRRRALIICITLHRRSGTGLSEESQEARLLLGKVLRKMQIL